MRKARSRLVSRRAGLDRGSASTSAPAARQATRIKMLDDDIVAMWSASTLRASVVRVQEEYVLTSQACCVLRAVTQLIVIGG